MENNKEKGTGIDINSLGKKEKIVAIVAIVGIIACFLPFVRISFMGISNSISILNSWFGWIILLSYIVIGALPIVGSKLDFITAKQVASLPKFISFGAGGLYLINVIRLLASDVPFRFLSIGFYLTFFASVALVIILADVIKLKD